MPLICKNCGATNQDPGGDPTTYYCGHCGNASLERPPDAERNRLAAAIAGASILGLATENPVGALIGALVGYALGDRLLSRKT
jgi:hypothetical protein